jgi:predicted rRNA methylase YqxC with S4 and FtsJ domains
MSILGILITSLCTPIGFSNLFTVLGTVIVQPELHFDVDQQLEVLSMEEAAIKRTEVLGSIPSLTSIDLSRRSLEEITAERNRLGNPLDDCITCGFV